MLSPTDLERLITEKKRGIEVEKTLLGLTPTADNDTAEDNIKNVTFTSPKAAENDTCSHPEPENTTHEETQVDGAIPPDLERYIRRYLGLPVMLRAGEYSPNNPLVRAERTPGDALRGLGEYERRRHTLRRAQQRQYREYLDQQAKKKQEAKDQAEREWREREEKERLEEERQRQREELERERRVDLERDRRVVLEQDRRALEEGRRAELERDRRNVLERDRSPEIRRASYTYTGPTTFSYVTKVDTGVQVDAGSAPLSVAVQTDDRLYTPNRQLCNLLTEAERELSPHTAEPREEPCAEPWPPWRERRRSCGDFDKPAAAPCREVRTVPRYQPSILDGDAVQLRNELAEKEALERRRWYERELRHQIQEQQRLRNQRTARERLLEQAETRRLEEQLRGLRVAHERERQRQRAATHQMKEHASEYDIKRNNLQQEIEAEERKLKSKQPDIPQDTERPYRRERPYSMNIPEDTLFAHNYDVESYLRRNLNPTKESLISNAFEKDDKLKSLIGEKIGLDYDYKDELIKDRKRNEEDIPGYDYKDVREIKDRKGNEGIRVHELPKPKPTSKETRENDDTLPIPVLRHSPKRTTIHSEPDTQLSDEMQIVDGKWRVPVVQKNILKSIANDGGKPVSILTQLGSIRRQLQMEQLKLDRMLSKNKQT